MKDIEPNNWWISWKGFILYKNLMRLEWKLREFKIETKDTKPQPNNPSIKIVGIIQTDGNIRWGLKYDLCYILHL